MPQNKTSDLKNHCFAMIEELNDLNDKTNPEEFNRVINKAKAISGLAGAINNTLKLELEAYDMIERHSMDKVKVIKAIGVGEKEST